VPQFSPVPGQQISLPVSAVPQGISAAKPMPGPVSGLRAPGSVTAIRLPRAMHQEYDAYIQSRRAMPQPGVPAAGVAMPAVGVPAQGTLHTTIAPGVMMSCFLGL